LQQAVREVLEKEAENLARESEETEKGYSVALWRKMADLGWMGVGFPEEYGGTGGDFLDLVLLVQELGRKLVPGPFIPSVACSGHAILMYGSEPQKRAFLPGITAGNLLFSPAFARPAGMNGNDGKEQVREIGDGHVVSGTRLFVPYAHVADWFIYGAQVDKAPTLFLVNAGAPGVNCSILPTIACDKQGEVVMENVSVRQTDVLGGVGNGKEIIDKIEEWGALLESAYILGLIQQVLKMSVAYAKQRVQFDKPIGSFQAIQHQCADMATDVDEVNFLTYHAAWELSRGMPAAKEISMAKARASDAARRISLLGTKIHGGIGITVEHDMQLYFRRAKAAEVAFGDGDFHREVVARQMGL
jgi:alkylation response protein AidB-like acyl-CoA dehydrogenase